MQSWALLEFAFLLAVAISVLALIIARLHVIERAEEQELWKQLEETVEQIK